ncbi:MAG: hypothetical protein HXY27_05820 [Hydrogenophilaceae bacterium]|nr:hypothetical protein [Hydrogenophilaceae bacterium]
MLNPFFRKAYLVCAALTSSLLWQAFACAAPTINIFLSDPSGIYQEAADSLTNGLHEHGLWTVNTYTLDRLPPTGSTLTVAIGTKALTAALAASEDSPVLSLLVPQATYERLASGSHQTSALYLDQPLVRQLRLLNLALPNLKQAGVPLGPSSRGFQSSLERASRGSGVSVKSVVVSQGSELLSALSDLAENSQAFVLLPDPVVAQRGTLQSFLLHTYRLRKPVLAYSAPLVQSGALLGLYASPAQLGEEAARWISESWIRGEFRLGPPRHPKSFTVSVNRTVARSLDISLPSEERLTSQLEAMK